MAIRSGDNILAPFFYTLSSGAMANAYTATDPDSLGTGWQYLDNTDLPIRGIWIGAEQGNSGAGTNGTKVEIGIVQPDGTAPSRGITLLPADGEGFFLPVSNLNKVCVKGYTNGDGLVWAAFG